MSLTDQLGSRVKGRTFKRPEIPHGVKGRYRNIKTLTTAVLLTIFFAAPWLRWHRGPVLPDQAILFDLPGRRLFLFGWEFWPQDLPIAVGVMVFSALALFYATTLAGRVWCGFACPQTVWSDLFFAVDRLIVRLYGHGSRERFIRNITWIGIALLTAFGFTAFFTNAFTLPARLLSGSAPPAAYVTILLLTGTTWLLAAYARERVCLHMCPWPRFQSALLDRQSLVVTYQEWRGEPRARKRVPLRRDIADPTCSGTGLMALVRQASDVEDQVRGDCIDCTRCVNVCPTGVDIRNGLQMGCIGCGLCIDACDDVMTRLERPKGLIRFDNETSERARSFEPVKIAWWRAKAMTFAGTAAIALAVSGYGAMTMPEATVDIEPQRNSPFVQLSDGSVRNDYDLRLAHRKARLNGIVIHAEGLENARLRLASQENKMADNLRVAVGEDRTLDERILVMLDRDAVPDGRKVFEFVVKDAVDGTELARLKSYFWGPEL